MGKRFQESQGNILPEARGDTKWRGAALILPSRVISGIWGGEQCLCGGKVGEWSTPIGSVRLSPCYVVSFPAHEKLVMAILRKGVSKRQSEEVESKWLKGGSLA